MGVCIFFTIKRAKPSIFYHEMPDKIENVNYTAICCDCKHSQCTENVVSRNPKGFVQDFSHFHYST